MKKVFYLFLCSIVSMLTSAQVPQLTVEQHLEDYDFAVKYIEDNYSGFSFWVNDSTRSDYEMTKGRLRGEVERGERSGWDAATAYTGWFSDFHMAVSVADPFAYFKRHFTFYQELMDNYHPEPVACKVTDKTFLIRFPSCGGRNPDMKWIKKSVKQYKKSHCENLIIDIRGNGGGADRFFYPYLRLVYDHRAPVRSIEFRNTPQNMSYLKSQGWFPGIQQQAIENPQLEYIPLHLMSHNYKRDKRVRKCAVIIDNSVASSGEEMVLEMRDASDRVTIYGRDNTAGCLDFSNVSHATMPNCGVNFGVPLSRSQGLPVTSVDKAGIAPDVRITLPLPARLTDNIDEWVIWVAEQLEK